MKKLVLITLAALSLCISACKHGNNAQNTSDLDSICDTMYVDSILADTICCDTVCADIICAE